MRQGPPLRGGRWSEFEADLVLPAALDEDALADYDVVVWGDSGYDDLSWTLEMAEAIHAWAEDGGGVVSTSWVTYALGTGPADVAMGLLTPIATGTGDNYCSGPVTLAVVEEHPVVRGFTPTFTTNSDFANFGVPLEGATSLVNVTSGSCYPSGGTTYPSVVVGELGEGRLVFAGLI